MRINSRKLKSLISEEKKASKEYRKLGFSGIAKDEARHSRYLRKFLNKNKKKWKTKCNGSLVKHGAKGYTIAPGTEKGNRYCARSWGQMQKFPEAAENPCSPLRLSRKKWKCVGKRSVK